MNKQTFTPQRILLLGRSGVGKTYNGLKYALQLVKNKIIHPKRVILMSFTFKSDESQAEFIDFCTSKYPNFKLSNCFENIDIELLKRLFNAQKFIKEKKPQALKHYLIIFDDQISSDLIKRSAKDSTLKQLFCVGRHYNLNQLWMLQQFKTLEPTCRNQFTTIAIFKQGNKAALKDLLADYDESPDPNPKSSLEELYRNYLDAIASNEGHGAFVINCLIAYGQGRLQKNLGSDEFYDK